MTAFGRWCIHAWGAFSRVKTVDVAQIQDTPLKRCLTVVDLTALGIGSTLGAGIYVLTGQVARYQAGPSIVLSFLIAAVASLLAGICYAEFAARVPRAGSAYIYSYVSVGELWAFVIGWNMILENMIGAASAGKAWSQYFDSLFNNTIKNSIINNVGSFHSPGLDTYPDFLSVGLLLLATLLVSLGVKMSSMVNFVFTIINLVVIVFIVGIGVFYADGRNWTQEEGGFFPFGFRGVVSGAATCFYAFVGFDTIATSGEEAKKPTVTIPIAIVATLVICFLAYFGVSSVLTLMVPWNEIPGEASLPKAFAMRGVYGADYIIAIGGICGLLASMMGSIFPLPRTVYAMAADGLVFRFLGSVNSWTNTPFVATWVCGVMAAILALLLDLDSLVQMMSIGTLMAYTLVAISVLSLHYQREHVGLSLMDTHQEIDEPIVAPSTENIPQLTGEGEAPQPGSTEDTGLLRMGDEVRRVTYTQSESTAVFKRVDSVDNDGANAATSNGKPAKELLHETRTRHDSKPSNLTKMGEMQSEDRLSQASQSTINRMSSTYRRMDSNYSVTSVAQFFRLGSTEDGALPTETSRRLAMASITIICIIWTSLCVLVTYGEDYVTSGTWWAIVIICVCVLVILIFIVVMGRQPRNQVELNFRVPLVPLLPLLSVLINIFLMVTLSGATWARFIVWMLFGFLVYFGYGVFNSSERRAEDQEVILYDVGDNDSILGVSGVIR